jgi:preprotein translocase subunit SecG
MMAILMVIHVFVTIALIGVVLIQRSEGGGLGIGSSQGMGAFISGRGTANLLTRTTAILAMAFLGLSLTMAVLNRGTSGVANSILAAPPASPIPSQPAAPNAPPASTPAPAEPAGPSVPH